MAYSIKYYTIRLCNLDCKLLRASTDVFLSVSQNTQPVLVTLGIIQIFYPLQLCGQKRGVHLPQTMLGNLNGTASCLSSLSPFLSSW